VLFVVPMMNFGDGASHTVEFSPALPYHAAFFPVARLPRIPTENRRKEQDLGVVGPPQTRQPQVGMLRLPPSICSATTTWHSTTIAVKFGLKACACT
jgi:hypothetical protein